MDSTSFRLSGISSGRSSYIDSLALNPKFHSLSTFLKKLKATDPQLRINAVQATKLEGLLKSVSESLSSLNDSNFSVSYDAFIKFYKTINLSHNLLHRYHKIFVAQSEEEMKKLVDEIEPLKTKSQKMESCESQLIDLKTKLAVAQERLTTIEDDVKKQTIQDIAKQINFSTKSTNAHSLVRTIKLAMKKSLSHVNTIVSEFNLPPSTTKENLLTELKKEIEKRSDEQKEKIDQQSAEIKILQGQLEDLNDQVITEDDFSPDDDKKKLQKTIIDQKRRIHRLEKELAKPKKDSQDVESLLKLYDDLTKQYRQQSDEMLAAINARSSLVGAIEKQNLIILALEEQLENRSNSQTNNRKLKRSKSKPASPTSNADQSKTEKDIISILTGIRVKKEEIQNICKSTSPIVQKVSDVVSCLTEYSFLNKELIDTNQKMFAVIIGQFKFIHNLSSSKECFSALYPEEAYEDCRSILISQVARIQNFINTYARGLAEDSCLFDDLLTCQNSQKFLESIKKYLGNYAKPQTLESEELFILLLQAIATNDILRKYGDEARKHNTSLSQKYKQLKELSDQTKKALEIQSSTVVQESNSKANETVLAAKAIIRRSMISDQNKNPDLTSVLEDLDNIAPVKDTEYVRALQKQNGELRKENFELKSSKEQLLNETKNDIDTLSQQLSIIRDESQKKLNKKNEENVALANKLKQAISRVTALKKEKEKISTSLTSEQKKYAQFEEQSNALMAEIQEQLNSTKVDFENVLKDTQTKSEELQQSKIMEVSQIKEDLEKLNETLKSENKKLKKAIKKEKASNNSLSKKYEDSIKQYEETITQLKQSESEAIDAADTFRKKFKEIHDDFEKLEVGYKAVQSRLDAKDEGFKREKSILETQYNAKIMAIEHDAQNAIEAAKSAQYSKQQFLLGEICKYFPGYVNIQRPISEETIFSMLQKMKVAIDSNTENAKIEEIMKEVIEILDIEDYKSIPSAILSLKKEIDSQSEICSSYEMAQVYIINSKEWLQRNYSMITSGMIDEASPLVMQKSIEDALLASMGKNQVSQRLETLKAEKKLLLMKVNEVQTQNCNQSLRHLMILTMYLMRMKKLAGYMKSQYSFAMNFPKSESEEGSLTAENPFSTLVFDA